VQRLGYSYWAERWFRYAGPALEALIRNMRLKPDDVTFFTVHAKIDAKHSEEVEEILKLVVKTNRDRRDVERVMETSLRLMGSILNEVYETYARLEKGQAPEFEYLNVLNRAEVTAA
jgi:pyrroloquinoline quinone (PQQ) biosynthesis protein C